MASAQAKPSKQAALELSKLVTRAQSNPRWFIEEVLQLKKMPGDYVDAQGRSEWEADEWQYELAESVADVWRKQRGEKTVINHEGKPFITMRSMHGPGKTFGMGMIDHYFNFCFPGRIFATAPKFKQVTTQLFPEFRKILQRAVPWYQGLIECNTTKATWCGNPDWCLIPDSAQNPENMAGKHWDYVLVEVDEASGVDEALWPVVYGVLSVGKICILLMISNPTKNQGTFADSHLKSAIAQDYFRFHISLDKTRRVKRDWVAKMIRKYGKDSPVVRVRCYGEFPGSSPNQVIDLDWIHRARNREFDIKVGDGSLPKHRVSVDCGGGGDNETVVTGCKHFASMVVGLRQTSHSFTLAEATLATAKAAIEMFDLIGANKETDDIVVDSLGVGVGVAGVLYARGYNVIMYQGGAGSDNKDRWRNRRVQSAMGCRDAFRDCGIVFVEDFVEDVQEWDDFDAQLCSLQHPPGTDKVDDLITKAQMVAQGLKSPDRADSLVMQFATQQPTVIPKNMQDQSQNQVEVQTSSLLEGLF